MTSVQKPGTVVQKSGFDTLGKSAIWGFDTFDKSEVTMINTQEKQYIKDLALRVKELSESKQNQKNKQKYLDANALRHAWPPPITIFLPQQAINEYMQDETLYIDDPVFSGIEYHLKWKLVSAAKLGDDRPVTDILYTGLFYSITEWIKGYKNVKFDKHLNAASFEPCLVEYSDLKKLTQPELIVDHEKTKEQYNQIYDVLGDTFTIIKGVPFSQTVNWGESMIDLYYEMRGAQQTFYDLADEPEFVHEVMDFLTNGKLRLLEQYKAEGILVLNNGENQLGSSSLGFCDELPGKEYNPVQVSEKNLWGFSQAQEFASVSGEMLEEFVLPYQAKIINKFGLSLYGCCEPMDRRIKSIEKHINNLRMLSISPFTDHEIAASACEGKYVYAWKPQPSHVVHFNEDAIREEAEKVFNTINKCCVTVSLLDVYTYKDINNFKRWLDIVREACKKFSFLF